MKRTIVGLTVAAGVLLGATALAAGIAAGVQAVFGWDCQGAVCLGSGGAQDVHVVTDGEARISISRLGQTKVPGALWVGNDNPTVPHQAFGTLTLDPSTLVRRTVTSPTALSTGFMNALEFTPSSPRTAVTTASYQSVHAPTGDFTATVRNAYFYTDASTTGSTAAVRGVWADVFRRYGTASTVAGITNQVFAQNEGSITTAYGVWSIVENGGAGTIASARPYYGYVANPGAGAVTNGYTFYAGTNDATNKWAFFSESGAGRGYFADSVQIGASDAAARPACAAANRGLLWHVFAGAGVQDTVAVCAKDVADAYAWRSIY